MKRRAIHGTDYSKRVTTMVDFAKLVIIHRAARAAAISAVIVQYGSMEHPSAGAALDSYIDGFKAGYRYRRLEQTTQAAKRKVRKATERSDVSGD